MPDKRKTKTAPPVACSALFGGKVLLLCPRCGSEDEVSRKDALDGMVDGYPIMKTIKVYECNCGLRGPIGIFEWCKQNDIRCLPPNATDERPAQQPKP